MTGARRRVARGLLAASAVVSLGALLHAGCKQSVDLRETPDAEADTTEKPFCVGEGAARTIGELPTDLAEPRALAAKNGAGAVVGVGADGRGLLVFVREGAAPRTVTVGGTPIAAAFDGAAAYVALSDANLIRVALDGSTTTSSTRADRVVVGRAGRAYGALGSDVTEWADGASARRIARAEGDVRGLAHDENDLFFTTAEGIVALGSAGQEIFRAPTSCDIGAPSVTTGSFLCVASGAIVVTSRSTGEATVLAGPEPGARAVVAVRGRAVWRTSDGAVGELRAAALDGIGGTTSLRALDGRASLVAADACGAYVVSENEVTFVPL